MRIRPCDALVEASNAQIGAAVRDLLRDCGVTGPPTPLDALLQYRRLSCTQRRPGGLRSIARRAQDAVHGMWQRLASQVAGILDLQSRYVLVNPHLHPRRQEFVAYHELGHEVLPWHRAIFVVTSESDLAPGIQKIFEAEANNFAAQAIFQRDHMARGHRGTRLQMHDLAGIAAAYGASLTATARHYVAIQDLPVALIVGRRTPQGDRYGIAFRYGIGNAAFLNEFEVDVMGRGFPAEAASSVTVNGIDVGDFEDTMEVTDHRSEQRILVVDTLYNSYETLTLVHPKPKQPHPSGTSRSRVRHFVHRVTQRKSS